VAGQAYALPGALSTFSICEARVPASRSAGSGFTKRDSPPPTPQLKIFDRSGRFVARVDFGWEEKRTVGEFDGKGKYGELLNPGQTPGDAIVAEKRREDLLRDRGWQVVRWMWSDLYRPGVIKDRLLRAFDHAG
jgi:hypothetical protein